MYGTVMIGKLKPGKLHDWSQGLEDWKRERNVAGFVTVHTLVADEGDTIVNTVVFESKDAYMALANDPEQDTWWRERVMPLLDGDPQWIDGNWV